MHRTLGPVGKARDRTHRTRRTANHRNQVTAAHGAGGYNDPHRREILREHEQRESLEALTSTSAAPRPPTAVGKDP